MPRKRNKISEFLERFSYQATRATGTSVAFVIALLVIVVWAITGPLFKFSDTWQLVINTGTTIVTFLMVFLSQRAQNKDALAIHLKLNEIVAAMEGASNRLIDVEDLSEPEIDALRKYYKRLIELAREDDQLTATHSIEEAASRHGYKYKKSPPKNTKQKNSHGGAKAS
jgi:low affinity Fe/Cu permease